MRHSSRYAFLLLGAATLLAAGCERPRSETAAEDTLATRTGETMYPDTGTPRPGPNCRSCGNSFLLVRSSTR